MRVGIIALLQESNTFIRQQTELEHFEEDLLLRGEALRERMQSARHEAGGFFAALQQANLEAVPIFGARALPYGIVTARTLTRLESIMMTELEKAMPLDALLVALHGAMVSEEFPDVDGHWLELLRGKLGVAAPIICTIDPHANLSPQMVACCNALVAYPTNPHLDQRERGIEAASLMVRTLRGEIQPTQAAAFPPLSINIERQLSSEMPCRSLYGLADQMLSGPGVLSNSIVLGFPYADVAEMGSSIVVVTDNNASLAQRLADNLAENLWQRRAEFAGEFIDVEEALRIALPLEGPICLLDMGDNVGGGSPGDGTFLAQAIHRRRLGKSFVCLFDPESVKQAQAAGIGQSIRLRVGGKTDALHGEPVESIFTIVSSHDGKYDETETRHGGFELFDQGSTAVVKTDLGSW